MDELFNSDEEDDDPDFPRISENNNRIPKDFENSDRSKKSSIWVQELPKPAEPIKPKKKHFRDVKGSCVYVDGSLPQDWLIFFAIMEEHIKIFDKIDKKIRFFRCLIIIWRIIKES